MCFHEQVCGCISLHMQILVCMCIYRFHTCLPMPLLCVNPSAYILANAGIYSFTYIPSYECDRPVSMLPRACLGRYGHLQLFVLCACEGTCVYLFYGTEIPCRSAEPCTSYVTYKPGGKVVFLVLTQHLLCIGLCWKFRNMGMCRR